jgi:catalase-peroxidase
MEYNYPENLVSNGIDQSPAGAPLETVRDAGAGTLPDAHDPSRTPTFMLTTDLSLRVDEKIITYGTAEFNDAFARAWFAQIDA